jgi:hypothetical protein
MNSSEETLRVLGAVAERIVHDLRTPLGIAASVLDDHLRGLSCTKEDFQDAFSALKNAEAQLSRFHSYALPKERAREECCITEVVRGALAKCEVQPILQNGEFTGTRLIDRAAVEGALVMLFRYLESRWGGMKTLSFKEEKRICIELTLLVRLPFLKARLPIAEVLFCDHSAAALSAYVCAACFKREGGDGTIEPWGDNLTLVSLWL